MVSEAGYVGLLLVSSTITLAAGVWLWSPERGLPGKLLASWAAGHALLGWLIVGNVFTNTRWLSILFFDAGTVVALAIPLLAFLFALTYTGRVRWFSRRVLAVFALWFVGGALLVVTDPVLGLAFDGFEATTGQLAHVVGDPTPVYTVVSFPSLLFAVAAPAILGARALSDSGVTRAQSFSLTVGFLVPFLVMSLAFGGVFPGPSNGGFVVGAAVTVGVVGFAVRRYHLFDVVPMSREMAFDEISEAVILVDRRRRLLDFNNVALEAFPALEGEIGTTIDDLVPQFVAAVDDGSDGDGSAVEGGDADTSDHFASAVTVFGEDGPRTYDVTASPLPSEDHVQGYGLVVRDVTERKRRMRDLEQQTAQLQRFASTLSHDIRNPLNVLQGRLEIAREDGDLDSLDAAERAVDRIEQIVEDLLTLSREGRTIDDPVPVTLADAAREAWETAETRTASLDVAIDPDYEVYADETRLRNVFENLFRNAAAFAGSDATIRVGWYDDGFFVEDDGPGIPADEREKVFEYEYTTTESGTGLGLAIVQSIARAHGWTVSVTEGSAGGARFVLENVDVVPSEARRRSDGTTGVDRQESVGSSVD